MDGLDPNFFEAMSKDKRYLKYFKMLKVGIDEEAGNLGSIKIIFFNELLIELIFIIS